MSFFGKVNRKIREIRRSDRKTKRNWLVGSTVIAMIVIVVLWVIYLNVTVKKIKIAREEESGEEVVIEEKEDVGDESVFSVFARGLKETGHSVSETFRKASEKVSGIFSGARDRLENIREYSPEEPEEISN